MDEISLSWGDYQFIGAAEALICCRPDNEGLLITWTCLVDLIRGNPQMIDNQLADKTMAQQVMNDGHIQHSPDLNESEHQVSKILSEAETSSPGRLVKTEELEDTKSEIDGQATNQHMLQRRQVIGEVRSMEDEPYQLIEFANHHALESTGFSFSKLLLIRIGRYCARANGRIAYQWEPECSNHKKKPSRQRPSSGTSCEAQRTQT